tara:strand:- start:423 stop:602 length:180 start_codon:yes stop_codon:yes gene_type:complete
MGIANVKYNILIKDYILKINFYFVIEFVYLEFCILFYLKKLFKVPKNKINLLVQLIILG